MSAPKIRILVDWDGDGMACRLTQSGDAANISPYPVTHHAAVAREFQLDAGETSVNIIGIEEDDAGGVGVQVDTTGATDNECGVGFAETYNGAAFAYYDGAWTLSASTQYTAIIWIRADAAISGLLWRVRNNASGTPLATNTIGSITADGTFYRYTLTFTTPAGTLPTTFDLVNNAASFPAARPKFTVGHLMIIEGGASSAPTHWNSGDTTNIYDDISDRVLDWRSKAGHSNPTDLVFSEGTLDVTLKNDDLRFTPKYTSSPLFGYLTANKRVWVEIYNTATSTWDIVWSGWTDQFEPIFSKGQPAKTRLRALQGRFYLEELPLTVPVTTNVTTDVVLALILRSGFISVNNRLTLPPDVAVPDLNLFIADNEESYTTEVGDSTLAYVGEDWERGKTTPLKALKDLMEVERGWLWLGRDGRVHFRNRNYYRENPSADHTIDVDTEVTQASYEYGSDIHNFIKVTMYPKNETENYQLWVTQGRIEVERKSILTTVATLEEPEGKKLTALAVNSFSAATSPSTFTAKTINGRDWSHKAGVSASLQNGEITLKLLNQSNETLYFTISLVGTALISYGGETIELSDTTSVQENKIKSGSDVSSKIITERREGTHLGEYLLDQFKDPYGTYQKVTLEHDAFDDTALEKILSVSLGDHVSVTDSQSGETSMSAVVMGESFSYQPGHIKCEYTLARSDLGAGSTWILGVGGTRLAY